MRSTQSGDTARQRSESPAFPRPGARLSSRGRSSPLRRCSLLVLLDSQFNSASAVFSWPRVSAAGVRPTVSPTSPPRSSRTQHDRRRSRQSDPGLGTEGFCSRRDSRAWFVRKRARVGECRRGGRADSAVGAPGSDTASKAVPKPMAVDILGDAGTITSIT